MDAERQPRTRTAVRSRLDAGIVLILIAGLLLLAQTALIVAANGATDGAPAVSAEASAD